MKKRYFLAFLTVFSGLLLILTACGTTTKSSNMINVITREEGSGTRGAFIELFSVLEEVDGEKVDQTSDKAIVSNSTAIVLTTVSGDQNAIGYVSTGSVDDSVKTLKIDGASPTVENIKDGSYKIARPFNIAVKDKISDVTEDFIAFIMSRDGQTVVEKSGYIAIDSSYDYQSSVTSGKLVISGSSSVTPVMEKLKEAYLVINPSVTIEIQQSDSSTGVIDTIDSISDIGMVSRELKDSELKQGITSHVIARDGIAIVVNKENQITKLTSQQVKAIFTGEEINWDNLISE
ncbi:substrate-binding domain-containing protein [Streptococcus marimammalium]|uniref:substrate-binding domain-containing protein n=1 Tax=Streptococcus marimammalium TaxID=269666 RepID=UPI00036874DB|nr:substrate-binding domain-containing protein [Streptococcus marimammalium]